MKFTADDIALMDALNNTGVVESNIYTTAQHGYMRNLDRVRLKGLEAIYKRVFNMPNFALCYGCGGDVMKMVLELYRELDKQKAAQFVPLQVEADPWMEPVILKSKKKNKGVE